jgi:hypothetical protein
MKNQAAKQTEPRDDVIALGTCEILEIWPGPVRLAPPIKPEFQPAWLDGWENTSKVMGGFSRTSVRQESFNDEPGISSPLNDL